MAFIWADKPQNDENVGLASGTNFKQFASSARKHSVKKQAFGEIKNVIHNQGAATPFKGVPNKWFDRHQSTGFGPTKSLCVDVLRKQQMKQNFTDAQKFLEKKLNLSPEAPARPNAVKVGSSVKTAIYEDLDDFDIPVNTCTHECTKSLEEIWGSMNIADEDFLNKVINGGDPDSDTEEDTDKDQLIKWSNKVDDDLFVEDFFESMPLCRMKSEIKMPSLPKYEFKFPELEETGF